MSLRNRGLAAVLGALLAGNAFADGRIEGRVGDAANNTYFEGALVRIEALNRTASTGRDGRFGFSRVPAGTHTITVEYLGSEPVSRQVSVADGETETVSIAIGERVEEIIVYGDSAGRASALNRQRSADNLINVISADSIGALPDANVAEALQRVPGIFLERDQGEGRFIGIRGIDPNLNATRINGLHVPAPESGRRSVALDVIPSDLLEGIEVEKTFTPDMDANAIGGTVNVKSLSAFDRGGRFLTFTAESSYNELQEEMSPKLAATFTDVVDLGGGVDNLGVALALSWFDRDFGSDNIETDGGWPDDLEGPDGEFRGAEEIEQRDYVLTRERFGAALNFDLRPTGTDRYYLRTLYSEFSDQEFRTRNQFKFDDGTAVEGTATSATWQDATIEKELKDRFEEQTILSLILGGENRLDAWTIDYSLGHSMGEELEPDRIDTNFVVEGVEIGYASIGEEPSLFASANAFDAASYELDEIVFEDNVTEDEQSTLALNAKRDLFAERYTGSLKFGLQYRTREKTNDATEIVYDGFPDDPDLTGFATAAPEWDIGRFVGPGVSEAATDAFFFGNRDLLEIDADDTLAASTAGDFELNEDVFAAYLMSTAETEDWLVVYGLRFESTEFDASGQRIVIDDVAGSGEPEPRAVSFDQSYSDLFPSVNARYRRGNLILRGAASRTISRPNFGELSPGGEIEFEVDEGENELSAEIGNPDLEPVESINLDFSVEYYPGGVGIFSAGVFYKQIENFIALADVAERIDLSQFVGNATVDDAEVIQPINGDDADVIGLELNYVKEFENGFFVSANATFVDTEARFPEREGDFDLPRNSDTVWNAALGYEGQRYSLRLAATFKSEALLEFEDIEDEAFDVYQDEHLQLDLSAKWNPTDTLQLFLTANNLTDEPFYAYFDEPRFNGQFEEYGRTYALGVRYTPFQ